MSRALIIDDEQYIREIIVEVLKMWGIESQEAEDGEQALNVVNRAEHPFEVVFIDLNLPNMSGKEVYERLVSILPDASYIFMSGFDQSHSETELPEGNNYFFLKKPFTLVQLRGIIDQLNLSNP